MGKRRDQNLPWRVGVIMKVKQKPITYAEAYIQIEKRIAELKLSIKREMSEDYPNPKRIRDLEDWKQLNENILKNSN